MPRIIFLILLLGLVFYLQYRFRQFDKDRQKKTLRLAGLGVFFGLLIVLLLTGRFSWLMALIGGLLPLIPRAARLFMSGWPAIRPYFQRYQQNRQSNMRSRFVSLQIDMLSGALQGEVLEGEYAGQKLQSMPVEQIRVLLEYCQQQDEPSASLLMAYLDRQHPQWNKGPDRSYHRQESAADSVMSQQHARDILGISDTVTKKDIIKAHKRLMQKLHPDRGGSDYLAGQINKARDVLLADFDD